MSGCGDFTRTQSSREKQRTSEVLYAEPDEGRLLNYKAVEEVDGAAGRRQDRGRDNVDGGDRDRLARTYDLPA